MQALTFEFLPALGQGIRITHPLGGPRRGSGSHCSEKGVCSHRGHTAQTSSWGTKAALLQVENDQEEVGYCSTLGELSLSSHLQFHTGQDWVDTSGGSIDGSGGLVAVGNLGWGLGVVRRRTAALD